MFASVLENFNRSVRLLPASIVLLFILLLTLPPPFTPCLQAEESSQAVVLEIQGTISPGVTDYFRKGMEKAASAKADLVILQMDTPGGLDHSMRDIIQMILASSVPVVSYVAPEGARAASAGTYILYASHVAAMSPATNLGAATPISIGGLKGPENPSDKNDKGERKEQLTDDATTLKRKVINDASAYIKALAERHGRNAEWAVLAVREAVSLSAEEALELKVIDFVANDVNDLLHQLDGHQILFGTRVHIISSGDMKISRIKPSGRDKLLAVISDPSIAYFLLLLGFYGLIYELANPGVFLPGVAGGISLLLAFYAFQILPINYSGLALIILGLIFLISEAFIPSFGSLGVGGIVAFAVGSLILIDDTSLRIPTTMIIGTTAVTALFLILLMGRALTIRRKKVRTGAEALIGVVGEAAEDFDGKGRIWLFGESWQAISSGKIRKGEKVRITSRKGLELTVESMTPPKGE